MCGRSFSLTYGLLQLFQICGIRVGERLIEVFDQGIQIGDVQRLCFMASYRCRTDTGILPDT